MRQARGKPTKTPTAAKKKQRLKLNIQQAIHEALDDYTAEHVDEYSSYASELVPVSPVIVTGPETKRRHSFDLQMARSPILAPKPAPKTESLPPLPPLSLDEKKEEAQGPTRSVLILALTRSRRLARRRRRPVRLPLPQQRPHQARAVHEAGGGDEAHAV